MTWRRPLLILIPGEFITREGDMDDTKRAFLDKEGLLNPKPERVIHPLFQTLDFFDPLDLPQVRYEMIRAARVENLTVTEACRLFGFSREYYYKLERSLMEKGYIALLGAPRGRRPLIRKLHNLNLTAEDIHQEIRRLYKVDCSQRTVERLLEKIGLGKKRHSPP